MRFYVTAILWSLSILPTWADSPAAQIRLSQGNPPTMILSVAGQPDQSFPLEIVPHGTRYYHWTSDDKRVRDWTAENRVPPTELKNRIEKGSDSRGGGVYVALSSTSSASFGNQVMIFETPKDLYVVPAQGVYKEHLDEAFPNRAKLNSALQNAGIQAAFASFDEREWMAVYDATALSKVHLGTLNEVLQGAKPNFFNLPMLLAIAADFPDTPMPDAPIIQQTLPIVSKYLKTHTLSESEKQQLRVDLEGIAAIEQNSAAAVPPIAPSPLLTELLKLTGAHLPEGVLKVKSGAGSSVRAAPGH